MPFNSNLANIFTTINAITSTINNNNNSFSSWQINNNTFLSLIEFDSLLSTDIYLELEATTNNNNNNNNVTSTTRSSSNENNSIDDVWDALTRYEWDQQQKQATATNDNLNNNSNNNIDLSSYNDHDNTNNDKNNNDKQQSHLRRSPQSTTTTTTTNNNVPSFPYIICSKQPQPTSGYTITTNWNQHLKQRYNISSSFQNILPLYNKPHMTCFVTTLAYDIASRIVTADNNNNNKSNNQWIIHPMAPEMKLSGGIVDNILHHSSSTQTRTAMSLEALICPGATTSSTEEKGRKGEEMMIIIQNVISSLGNNSQWADDDDDAGNEKRRRRRSLVSERFLRWELLRHHDNDNHSDNDDPPSQRQQQQQQSRRQLWDDALRSALDSSSSNQQQQQQTTTCQSHLIDSQLTPSRSGDAIIISPPSNSSSSCLLSLIAALSLNPQICLITTTPTLTLQNDVAQWIVQTGGRESSSSSSQAQDPISDRFTRRQERRSRPWFDVGLTGKGQTIAISDSGLDVSHCYFWDGSGEVRKSRWGVIDHTRRKVVQYVSYADDEDGNGHGTHVTATAVGRRTTNGRDELTGKMDGMARDAKVAFFDVEKGVAGDLTIPYDFDDLFRPGYKAGARIHSASWGGPTLEYDFVSRDVDDFSYRNDDFLAIFAAGNQGNDRGFNTMKTINTPALAKNALAVGASQSADDSLDYGMLGFDYLADFSSRGPTPDGRTKPDVVAPGYYITSARPSTAAASQPCGSATQRLAGTSFATPIVSGTALLIRQYFMEGWYPTGRARKENVMENPSGSLVKAVLINGARYLKGVQQGRRAGSVTVVRPYDNNQNYGRVSLIDSLRLGEESDDDEDEEEEMMGNGLNVLVYDREVMRDGEVKEFDIIIGRQTKGGATTNQMCGKRSDDDDDSNGGNGRELSVTLVWTDPPSYPGCRSCVLNDLDLEITKQNQDNRITSYYYPNGRTSRDDINNVERIRLERTDWGERYTVRVRGYDLQSQYQLYSLVVAGCFELYEEGEEQEKVEEVTVTPSPTVSPVMELVTTPMPTVGQPILPSKTITTSYRGLHREAGNMFDIVARSHILITGMSIHTRIVTGAAASDSSPLLVSIYTKRNSHANYEKTPSAWTSLVTSHPIIGRGASRPTPLPSSIFQNNHDDSGGSSSSGSSGGGGGGIEVRPGERMAFYVTLNVDEMLYGRAWWFQNTIARNSDLEILVGVACEYEFGKVWSPRTWNGALEYVVLN